MELLIAGPPSLTHRIDWHHSLEATDACVHVLDAPSQQDLMSYVEWRLRRFELSEIVTPVANQMIARLSGGRYAAVDVLCQMSLLLLRQLQLPRIDARVARQAVAALASRQSTKLEATDSATDAEQRAEVPPAHVLVSRGGKVMMRVTLGQRTLLGRSEHNDICLPSPYLSRHHAAIVGTPQGYYVVDLNSINGLSLNGRQVERAVLCDEDILTMGPFKIKIQVPEWLASGDPLPKAESLADTAVMPPPERPPAPSAVRRVK